jgi:membrane protease YdiL (CAAX protease family)
MTENNPPITDYVVEPRRRGLPLSIWIIPDAIVGLILTIFASLILTIIAAGIAFATGTLTMVNGSLLLSDGTVVYGPGASPDALQNLILSPGFLFWSVLLQNLAFIGVVLFRIRLMRHLPLTWLGLHFQKFGKMVLIGIGFGFAFIAMNVVTSWAFDYFFDIRQNQADQFPIVQGDILGQALFFVAAAVIAPIGEEIFFRGYIFNALRQDLGPMFAIIMSAVIFSLVHFSSATEGVVALLIPILFGGILLALANYLTDSLVPCIIAHAMNNGLSTMVLIACTNNPNFCQA